MRENAWSDSVVQTNPRSPWNEFWGWSSHLELWESRIREYEKLIFQTEKIQDSCKVFIVRSLVPKDLEKDLLQIHTTANYKTTKRVHS